MQAADGRGQDNAEGVAEEVPDLHNVGERILPDLLLGQGIRQGNDAGNIFLNLHRVAGAAVIRQAVDGSADDLIQAAEGFRILHQQGRLVLPPDILHGVEHDQEAFAHKTDAVVLRMAEDDLLLPDVAEKNTLQQLSADPFLQALVLQVRGGVVLQDDGNSLGHHLIFIPVCRVHGFGAGTAEAGKQGGVELFNRGILPPGEIADQEPAEDREKQRTDQVSEEERQGLAEETILRCFCFQLEINSGAAVADGQEHLLHGAVFG